MLTRTLELLASDIPGDKLPASPRPKIMKFGANPILVFGPVTRPEFVIDESELPY